LEEARRYIDRMRSKPPEEAIPKLLELLRDESWYLRERAGTALAGFGPEAAPAVEDLTAEGLWYARAAALQVLGKIAAPRSLCRLFDFLEDPNRTTAEEACRALLGFCCRDRALVVAKILHGRGQALRDKVLATLGRLDADGEARLRRLIESDVFMGPEGSLEAGDEQRLAEAVSDERWGVSWAALGDPTSSLPEPPENLVRYLRGSAAP
jgi:HEAT repeat protein